MEFLKTQSATAHPRIAFSGIESTVGLGHSLRAFKALAIRAIHLPTQQLRRARCTGVAAAQNESWTFVFRTTHSESEDASFQNCGNQAHMTAVCPFRDSVQLHCMLISNLILILEAVRNIWPSLVVSPGLQAVGSSRDARVESG